MKLLPLFAVALLFQITGSSRAEDAKPAAKTPTQEELEAKFTETLTKATMAGRWCPLQDGVMGPEKEDKYTIVGVKKVSGDDWVISARIQYGSRDVVAPIPVQVKWAGDTAVIIVNQLQMPTGGSYSARVLVHEHTYAGSWSGVGHAGLLNGVITNEAAPASAGAK